MGRLSCQNEEVAAILTRWLVQGRRSDWSFHSKAHPDTGWVPNSTLDTGLLNYGHNNSDLRWVQNSRTTSHKFTPRRVQMQVIINNYSRVGFRVRKCQWKILQLWCRYSCDADKMYSERRRSYRPPLMHFAAAAAPQFLLIVGLEDTSHSTENSSKKKTHWSHPIHLAAAWAPHLPDQSLQLRKENRVNTARPCGVKHLNAIMPSQRQATTPRQQQAITPIRDIHATTLGLWQPQSRVGKLGH